MITQDEYDIRDKIIDYDNLSLILSDWVKHDTLMHKSGQNIALWNGSINLPRLGQLVIVWPGCAYGQVADYGIKRGREKFELAVWVKLNNDQFIKMLGGECCMLTDDDRLRLDLLSTEFRAKLINAGKKVQQQKKERRSKAVPGSHLLDEMLEKAKDLNSDKKSSFYKITGSIKGLAVYVAIKGGRVDLSGFNVEHISCIKLTEDEARAKHLGRVRGQLDFSIGNDETIMEGYILSLSKLNDESRD